MYRLAILTSHPIQYQAPLFKKISEHPEIHLTVYFRKKKGAFAPFYDKEFGKKVQWDIPLLEGYSFRFLSGCMDIAREMRRDSYDAVMLYGWNSWLNIFTFIWCYLRKTKIFMYGETPLNQEMKKHGLWQKAKQMVLRFLFKRVSAFLCIGEENKKFYEYLGVPEQKCFFMPYAVDNARWRRDIEHQKSTEKKKPMILFVGKLIPKKHPLDLIQAFAPFHMESELVLTGDGELRKELEKYVKDEKIQNIQFAGFVNQGTLQEYYANADIFVLPSGTGETWGLVVNEAMNFSLPVIVSKTAGCAADLVYHGKNGYVYPEGDVEKLSEYMGKLVRNKPIREKFGQESTRIINYFSYEKDVEGIIQALSLSR